MRPRLAVSIFQDKFLSALAGIHFAGIDVSFGIQRQRPKRIAAVRAIRPRTEVVESRKRPAGAYSEYGSVTEYASDTFRASAAGRSDRVAVFEPGSQWSQRSYRPQHLLDPRRLVTRAINRLKPAEPAAETAN